MKNEMFIGQVLPKIMIKEMPINSISSDNQRLLKYKIFSCAFSYPGDDFFKYFPQLSKDQGKIIAEYDSLFRKNDIWLYTTEYTSKGTFQRSQDLSNIGGFYKAFGLELDKDRPDSLFAEFEFMHYLIFKRIYAAKNKPEKFKEKESICSDAQVKFFNQYLYPGAKAIAARILSQVDESVYKEIAEELLIFLEQEKDFLKT